jgi:hypothetical protein
MSKLNIVRITMMITFSFLMSTSRTFSMDWFKKLVGWKTVQQPNNPVTGPTITIKEINKIGNLSFTITEADYIDNYKGGHIFSTGFLSARRPLYQIKSCTLNININACDDTIHILGTDNATNAGFLDLRINDDKWLIRALFFGFQTPLLKNITETVKAIKPNEHLSVTLNPHDPGYTSSFDAYSQAIDSLNQKIQKNNKAIAFVPMTRAPTWREQILYGGIYTSALFLGYAAVNRKLI